MGSELDLAALGLFVCVALGFVFFGKASNWPTLLPFALSYSVWIEFGTRWTPAKSVPLILFAGLILRGAVDSEVRGALKCPRQFRVFLMIAVLGTIIGAFIGVSDTAVYEVGLFQRPGPRSVVQFGTYMLALLYFVLPAYLLKSWSRVRGLLLSYLIATSTLSVYGVYQLVAYYLDLPFRGIIYSPTDEGMGLFHINQYVVPRLNSFANEPKQLAVMLLPSILTLLLSKAGVGPRWPRWLESWLILVLHLFVFVFTFSTAGFVAAGIVAVLFLPIVRRLGLFGNIRLVVVTGIVLLGTLSLLSIALGGVGVRATMSERTVTALAIERIEDRVEFNVLNYLASHPLAIVLGTGPGNYNFRLEESGVAATGTHGVDPLDSTLLTVLIDFGIVGVLSLFAPMLSGIHCCMRLLSQLQGGPHARIAAVVVACGLAALAAVPLSGLLMQAFFFCGIASAVERLAVQQDAAVAIPRSLSARRTL